MNAVLTRSVLLLLLALLTACSNSDRLDRIRQRGELLVVTRNAPTTYYEGRDGLSGFEYDLASAYAQHLGVKIRFIVADNIVDMLLMLDRGEADFVAAGITRTEERARHYRFSVPYQSVTQQVICRRGGKRPKNVQDLAGVKLAVSADSSYDELLQQLKLQYPDLRWHANPKANTETMLEWVWDRKLDCTVADSNIVDINRRYYPELAVRFDLSTPQQLGWVMPLDANALAESVNHWLRDYVQSDDFAALHDKYYGFIEVFDFVDIRAFKRRIKSHLPKYRALFEKAAETYGFDWTYLAAQAYQESHWNPRARSPTGVRGMMMLTRATAHELGVKNRLDPARSIQAGSRYLSQIRKRLPASIDGLDRDWMTLAAYNVGMGHVYDARHLARRKDKNPDLWRELVEVLPLLSQKKYYKTLKHGYARGREPVLYVQRIRDYQDILVKTLQP